MIILNLLFVALLGLIFGSFIAAFSWRYPRGMSIVKGRSMCPKCKYQIAWYDNIPLFSFLLLRGKCRKCKKNISWRYFLIELATCLGFVIIFINYSSNIFLLLYLIIIFLVFALIFIVDMEHKIIPDSFVFFGIMVSIFAFILADSPVIFTHLLAGFLGAVFLLLIHLFTKGKGMGLGDVKFAVLAGLFIGLKMLAIWLFVAFLTGAFVGIVLMLVKHAKLKDQIPFGPFLVVSLGLTFIFGNYFLKFLGF